MLALHYCTDSVTHATSLAFTVRYADALRRCVTVGYGCVLRYQDAKPIEICRGASNYRMDLSR